MTTTTTVSSSQSNLATAKAVLSAAASVAAAAMVVRSVAQDYMPDEVRYYFSFGLRKFFSRFSSQMTMVIDEFEGFVHNEIYEAAETYLGSKISSSTRRIKVSKPEKENNYSVTIERDEEVTDIFNNVRLNWVFISRHVETKGFHNPRDLNSTLKSEVRSFELSFPKKFKKTVLDSYLPFVVKQAKSMKEKSKTLKIFTIDPDNMYGNFSDAWTSVNLDHPATFDTLAMDSELKIRIMEDLDRFVKRRDYYKRVGKAWKRGYLLYGPPGTGKSSLIAAMANYLNFDIYDLELTELNRNSELRGLLVGTANRSILVVEDIDCTIDFKDRIAEAVPEDSRGDPRQKKVTLSGLLNFIDGLWSSCGDERIIIFTTNHKEKLDPALLRPGRMDMHIHMSYCTPCGFRVLANNYLEIKDHALFGEIEEGIRTTEITPAEVAEQLMRNDGVEAVLEGLIEFLKKKKTENEEAKAKKKEEDSKADKEEDQKGKEKEKLVEKKVE